MAGRRGRRTFGAVRELPSGRWQASYLGPNGKRYSAKTEDGTGLTFDTSRAADAWLAKRSVEIGEGRWVDPDLVSPDALTFGDYAEEWLAHRDLEVRTRDHYRALLDNYLFPTFEHAAIVAITPTKVREWHASLDPRKPTAKSHAYGLLRTIMGTAATDEIVLANPCRIRGAGQTKRARTIRPASLGELQAIVEAIPARYRAMVLLASWCALRFGELAELRRADVEIREVTTEDGNTVKVGTVRIRRGVVRSKAGEMIVKGPKSEAGVRSIAIPPHLVPIIEAHLEEYGVKPKGLLFPSADDPTEHMVHSTLNKVWLKARKTADREDLAFHDLRHTGAVLAAVTGATLAELMARLGHSTPGAAMRYQHAAADRDRAIADALSRLVTNSADT